jgi:adenosylcobinamide-GDP ribazoletransferase
MSDKQFEDFRHREQDLSEKKTEKSQDSEQNLAEGYTKKRTSEGRAKKRPINTKNHVKAYIEEPQDQKANEDPWYVQKGISDGYIEEPQDQEEPEDPWPTRNNTIGEDINEPQNQEYTQNWTYDKENISEDYLEEPQDDKQSEVANQQLRLASHFKFMRRFGHQYKGFVTAENIRSQQELRPNFVRQLRNQYEEIITAVNAQSQQVSRPNFMRQLRSQYKEIVAAGSFLSILPFAGRDQSYVGSKEAKTQPQLVIGSAYFPLIGLVIALIACLLLVIGLALHLPPLVLAALLTVALVWLTGGLHLDGLMDTCDGLFGSSKRERRLEIMRDSHVGAFGVLGGICIVLLKFAIFASLDPRHLALALVIGLPLARWAMVLVISLFPSARPTGLGATARQTVTRPRILIAATTSLLIALLAGQLIGLAVWIVGSLFALMMGIWVTYTLNGLTGDIYGAIAETTEVACFLVLVAIH